MQTATLKTVLGRLVAQAGADAMRDLSDAELLERFRGRREEAAFALLVQRHGPMVLGVCRRVLGDLHAAEDAFQATFLVLVRKADSIRQQRSLASWLYGVAQRTAVRARTQSAERHRCERERVVSQSSPDALEALTRAELYAVLDEEIGRLPDKYRGPLVLCCLEGKTHEQAAQEMVWPKSSVTARLKRARELLRQRLVRRGVALPGSIVAALLAEQTAAQATSAHLTLATVRRAAEALVDQVATATTAVTLAGGMVKGLTTTKLAAALALLLTVGLAVAGVGVLVSPKEEPETPLPQPIAQRSEQPKAEPVETVPTDRYGDPLPDGVLARFGTTRLRHLDGAQLIFSADGNTLLSIGRDLFVQRWDISTGKLVGSRRALPLPQDVAAKYTEDMFVYQILSPDGKRVAYQTEKNLYFFDVESGKELQRIPLETNELPHFLPQFTPDGKQFAFTIFINKNYEFYLFDLTSGQRVETAVQKKCRFCHFAFNRNGTQLATFDDDKEAVILWEMPEGKRLHTIQMPKETTVSHFMFTPDGKRLYAIAGRGKSGQGFIWNTVTGETEANFPSGSPWSFTLSRDGALLAVPSREGIVLRDAKTGKEIRQLTKEQGYGIVFSADGKTLAATNGVAIRLWNVADGKPLHDLDSHTELAGFVYSPDGKRLASGDWFGGVISIWDVATTKRLMVIQTKPSVGDSAWPLHFSGDSQTLIGKADNGILKAWDVNDGTEKAVFRVSDDAAEQRGPTYWGGFSLSRDGKRLSAIHSEDKGGKRQQYLVIWDFATGKRLSRTKLGEPNFLPAFMAPNGRLLGYWTGSVEKEFKFVLYDVAKQQTGVTLPWTGYGFYHRFSPDASLFPMFGSDAEPSWKTAFLGIWDTATGTMRVKLPTGHIGPAEFSPDNRFLLTVSATELCLWELATGKVALRRRLDETPCFKWRPSKGMESHGIAFAPDGRSAATGLRDYSIVVWDLLPSSRRKADLTSKDLTFLWTALGSDDAAKAYDAGGRLLAAPETSTAFLSKQLRPLADETKRIRTLIAALNDDEFTKREAARKDLEQLGLLAEPELRRTLDGKPSAETRRAVEALLADVWTVRTAEDRRQLRAVWVLEQIGSAEARQTLKRLADGAAGAWQTREARSALTRLDVAK